MSMNGAQLLARSAQAYVDTCAGDPVTAVKGRVPVWRGVATAELLQWLCGFNAAHPTVPTLIFVGFAF